MFFINSEKLEYTQLKASLICLWWSLHCLIELNNFSDLLILELQFSLGFKIKSFGLILSFDSYFKVEGNCSLLTFPNLLNPICVELNYFSKFSIFLILLGFFYLFLGADFFNERILILISSFGRVFGYYSLKS